MFCKECGNKLEEGAKFCPTCGVSVSPNQEQGDVLQAASKDQAAGEAEEQILAMRAAQEARIAAMQRAQKEKQAQQEMEQIAGDLGYGRSHASKQGDAALTQEGDGDVFSDQASYEAGFAASRTVAQEELYEADPASYGTQEAYPEHSPYAAGPGDEPPKRGGKGRKLALIIVAALVVLGLIAGFAFGKDIKRMVLGPQKMYLALESSYLKGKIQKGIDTAYDWAALDNRPEKFGYKVDLAAEVENEDLLDPAVAELVQNLSFEIIQMVDSNKKNQQLSLELRGLLKKENLVSGHMLMDKDRLVVALPGLTEQKFLISREYMDQMLEESEAQFTADEIWAILENTAGANVISRKDMIQSSGKLADVLMKHMKDVTWEKNAKVQSDVVKGSFERYTVKMTGEQILAMTQELLETVRDDATWYKAAHSVYTALEASAGYQDMGLGAEMAALSSEEDWKEAIDSAIDSIKEVDKEEAQNALLTQNVYVGKSGAIEGREIYLEDKETEEVYHLIYFSTPQDGKNFQALNVGSDESVVQIQNTWTQEKGKKTGEILLIAPDAPQMKMTYKDYAEEKLGVQPVSVGQFTIYLPEELEIPLEKLTVNGTMEKGRYKMEIRAPGFGGIVMGMEALADKEIVFPSYKKGELTDVSQVEDPSELLDEEMMENAQSILEKLGLPMEALMGL